MQTKQIKNKIGLTLVEILIVVSLIGVLAAVAIPNYLRSRQNSGQATLQQTLNQMAQLMEQIFWGQNPNEYPPASAFPNTLRTWAAPTNLGNIDNLIELIKKYCLEFTENKTAAVGLASTDTELQALFALCIDNQLIYVPSSSASPQSYMFSALNPYNHSLEHIFGSAGVAGITEPSAVPVPPPPPPSCGDGVKNGSEQCDYTATPAGCPSNYVCGVNCYCYYSSGGGSGDGGCFLAGTNILMADGSSKSIETITVGETLMTYDETTQQNVAAKVLITTAHDVEDYMIVNDSLKVTGNHVVYLNGHWREIKEAQIGDTLQTVEGKPIAITSLKLVSESQRVYNFEVDTTHTYYANNLLVHNVVKTTTRVPLPGGGSQNDMIGN